MTQQLDPTFVPQQRTTDPAPQGSATQGWPAQGWPTATAQNPGYPPGSPGVGPTAYPGMAPYGGPAPAGYGVDPGRSGGGFGLGRLLAIISAATVVIILLGGVLMWLVLDPGTPAAVTTPAPATSQPAVSQPAGPAAPAEESPAVAAAARQQLAGAVDRYNQAAQRFSQQAKAASRAGSKEGMRRAVTDFRAATYGYDAEIRAITFPNAQQTVVNTQLLPATGRLVGDLDQFANLDPATVDATGDRVMADLQTSMSLTQQIMTGLGG